MPDPNLVPVVMDLLQSGNISVGDAIQQLRALGLSVGEIQQLLHSQDMSVGEIIQRSR